LLKEEVIGFVKRENYVESSNQLPTDYFEWKRINGKGRTSTCSDGKGMVIYLAEEGNVDELLRDKHKQPSFPWGETFCTLKTNHVRVYTNDEFEFPEGILSYYKQPVRLEIAGCVDPYTQVASPADIECEFKDDIIELFVDEAAKILAGDIESFNQQQTASGQVEGNN
jgi:hypothetical protein